MLSPLTIKEFYAQTLKQAGFTPPDDQIEKFASANKLDLETTKIASAVFEQLQLDGVKYDTHQDMLQDALKIAHAFADHVKEASAQAEKIAGDLHRVARHAIEGYLAQHGIDLNADEGVKIAGLQAQSFQELTQKQAALRQLELLATLKFPEDKVASEKVAANIYQSLPGAGAAGGGGMWDEEATVQHLSNSAGGTTPEHLTALKGRINADIQPHERPDYINAVTKEMHTTGLPFPQAHSNVMGRLNQAPKPGLMARPGMLLGAGAIGLGGLYLMKKRREEAARRDNAVMSAASMPAA